MIRPASIVFLTNLVRNKDALLFRTQQFKKRFILIWKMLQSCSAQAAELIGQVSLVQTKCSESNA